MMSDVQKIILMYLAASAIMMATTMYFNSFDEAKKKKCEETMQAYNDLRLVAGPFIANVVIIFCIAMLLPIYPIRFVFKRMTDAKA